MHKYNVLSVKKDNLVKNLLQQIENSTNQQVNV